MTVRVGIDAANIRGGGGLTHLREILRAAQPEEHGVSRVTVWTSRKTLEQLPDRPWLELIHIPALDRALPARLRWRQAKLGAAARSLCDVLYVPGGGDGAGFRPYVTMSRNMLPFEIQERNRYGMSWMRVRLGILRRSQARGFQDADGMIFLTEYAHRSVMEQVGKVRGRITVIPHGVDSRFVHAPREQRGLNDCSATDPLRLLYVSIVDVYKHQWHVAAAVASLYRDGLPVQLDLIGPAYPPALKRLQAELQQIDPEGRCVHYRGPLAYAELPAAYHAAEVFVFASSCENMPNILLEGMASGLPITCAAKGPMPEVLGDAGVYFDPEDPADIAHALRRLIESPTLRADCAAAASQRAAEYSWERCARQTFTFLHEVATAAAGEAV